MNEAYFIDIAVGALIQARRRRRKLTQAAVAKAVGVSQGQISRIEAGAGCTVAQIDLLEAKLGKRLVEDARAIVVAARHGAGAIQVEAKKHVLIGTEELIPIVAARWT